jgi:hypothetical protein
MRQRCRNTIFNNAKRETTMSLAALIASFFERIGKNMTLPVPDSADSQNAKGSDPSIRVTPARRPIWPVCCG